MHGPREVFQQEPDGEDIEQHAKRAAQAVVRFAGRARCVADGHLGYAGAVETRQRGNEAVQLAVQIDVLQNLGAVGLERGAEIAQIDARTPSPSASWRCATGILRVMALSTRSLRQPLAMS